MRLFNFEQGIHSSIIAVNYTFILDCGNQYQESENRKSLVSTHH